jgi:hypothetical protein
MGFVGFMTTVAGRGLRVAAGVVLILVGVLIGGAAGSALGVVGLVPLAAGGANVCLFAPVVHAPFRGRAA